MKVYQLIEKLLTFNQQATVVVEKDSGVKFKHVEIEPDNVFMLLQGGGEVAGRDLKAVICIPLEEE